MNKYYVYILKCSDGKFYTGITNDLNRRLAEHNEGANTKCYTYRRRPLLLVYSCDFANVNEAIALEKQVKKWSAKKKQALIDGNWEILKELASCKNSSRFDREK